VKENVAGRVLDLGCGYGVVGIVLKKLYPETAVLSTDVNPRALELAELNCKKNHTECEVRLSDGFANIPESFELVITNPPIRTGKKVIYPMFEDAFSHLVPGGVFLAVIRRQQGAESALKKLKEIFGNCEVTERKKGYWILKSIR
jgi:16S rRNA (guanine1207-N2)-methyltransferase